MMPKGHFAVPQGQGASFRCPHSEHGSAAKAS